MAGQQGAAVRPAYYPQAAPAMLPPIAVLPGGQPLPQQARVDLVPGTPFGLAFLRGPATVSGVSIGGMVAGIASILVALISGCFGVVTPAGIAAGGAFAILAALFGIGGIVLGMLGLRQGRRGGGRVTGRAMAITGISCGGTGLVLSLVAVIAALVTRGT